MAFAEMGIQPVALFLCTSNPLPAEICSDLTFEWANRALRRKYYSARVQWIEKLKVKLNSERTWSLADSTPTDRRGTAAAPRETSEAGPRGARSAATVPPPSCSPRGDPPMVLCPNHFALPRPLPHSHFCPRLSVACHHCRDRPITNSNSIGRSSMYTVASMPNSLAQFEYTYSTLYS